MEDKLFEDDQFIKDYTAEIRTKIYSCFENLQKDSDEIISRRVKQAENRLWSVLFNEHRDLQPNKSEELKRLSTLIKIYERLVYMSENKYDFKKNVEHLRSLI